MKAFWIIALLGFTSAACAVTDDDYVVQQVADGVYFHQGVHEDANEDNIGAIANVGFAVSKIAGVMTLPAGQCRR